MTLIADQMRKNIDEWFSASALSIAVLGWADKVEIVELKLAAQERDLFEIRMQATRYKRASDEQPYLLVDVKKIARLAGEKDE